MAAVQEWLAQPSRRADAATFLVTAVIAVACSWRASDLMWALWVTGLVSTLAGLVLPWLLLTVRPDIEPAVPAGTRYDRAQIGPSMLFLNHIPDEIFAERVLGMR